MNTPCSATPATGSQYPTTTELAVTSKSGKTFPVTITLLVPTTWPSEHDTTVARLAAFGVAVELKDRENMPCIYLASSVVVKSSVAAFFGQKLKPKTEVYIALSEASHADLLARRTELLAPYVAERAAHRAQLEAERAAAPKRYFYESGTYWGDYATEFISLLVAYRPVTATEVQAYPARATHGWVKHAILASDVPATTLADQGLDLLARPVVQEAAITSSYDLREISETEVAPIVTATTQAKQQRAAQKAEQEAQKEAARQQQLADQQQHRQTVVATELFVWDADQVYSSATNELLHSLGGRFSQQDNYVGLYTTGYSRDIPGANTTYSLRTELAAAGLVFEPNSKEWRLPYSEQNAQTVLDLLARYDTKAWPAELGMGRCWECGRFSNRLDRDGYCGC